MSALTVSHVSREFLTPKGEKFKALDDVSLQIEQGKIYGLLGPNGAGKSTLINMICGALKPTSGSIELFGMDVVREPIKTKQLLGIVPQEVVIEAAFTVEEVLYYFSGLYGVPVKERGPRTTQILEDLNLSDKRKDKANRLSGGMKRRLMIAKAMIHKPKLLILDEPTAGVDVALRQRIWEVVRRLNAEGTTIVFTTHYLEEAEQLCEAITLIDHGHVIKDGKLKDIQREFSVNAIHFELFEPNRSPMFEGVRRIGNEFEYPMKNLAQDMKKIAEHYGDNIKSIRNENASLEQIFLELTNK